MEDKETAMTVVYQDLGNIEEEANRILVDNRCGYCRCIGLGWVAAYVGRCGTHDITVTGLYERAYQAYEQAAKFYAVDDFHARAEEFAREHVRKVKR